MIEPNVIKGSYNGLPYEGPPLNLKNDDPESMKPRLHASTVTKVYDMSDSHDLAEYTSIMDAVAKGHVRISFEEREWVPRLETWKILLRTLNLKYIEPEDISRAEDS
jgi:hypothetical protein